MLRSKLIALALPLLLAGACNKDPKVNDPTNVGNGRTPKDKNSVVLDSAGGGNGGSTGGTGGTTGTAGGGTPTEPTREVTKKSVTKFQKAVEDYNDAKASGKLADKCTKIADDFADAYKEDKDLIEGNFNAGAVLLECGKKTEAKAYFDKVLAQNKGYARAITSIGYILYLDKKYAEAEAKFTEAANTNDADGRVEAYINLASLQIQKFYSEPNPAKRDSTLIGTAQTNIRRALATNSTNVQAYAAFAVFYYKIGKDKLAELVCQKAIADGLKDYAPIYHMLGLVAVKNKKVTAALKYFNDAIAKDPNYVPSLMNVGALTIRFRDYKTSKEMFARVVANEPNNYDAIVSLGVAHRGLQDYDNAEKMYKKGIELNAAGPAPYFNLGNLYQDYAVGGSITPLKKVETAKDYYVQFKAKAGSAKEWESFVKQADKRITQCDQLISVYKRTAAAPAPTNP